MLINSYYSLMKPIFYQLVALFLMATPLTAQQGNSLNFDGTDDYVITPGAAFATNTDYTIEGYFRTQSTGVEQEIVAGLPPSGGANIQVELQPNGTLRFLHRVPATSTGGTQIFSTSLLTDDDWHHFAAVKGPDDLLRLYIDGTLEATSSVTVVEIPGTFDLVQGILRTSSGAFIRPLNGSLDDLRFWSVARTATQIRDNMDDELTGNEPDLSIYYTFNQGIAGGDNGSGCPGGSPCEDELIDGTGNGQNGTLTNFALTGPQSNFTADSPMPVEMTYFRATPSAEGNYLEWETATETDNAGFEVQRSTDLAGWDRIGFVAGQGTSVVSQRYSFTDTERAAPTTYYRLKQIDFDGAFALSGIIALSTGPTPVLAVFPNPTAGDVRLSDPTTVGQFTLLDLAGRQLQRGTFQAGRISLAGAASGTYLLRVVTEGSATTVRVVKQ